MPRQAGLIAKGAIVSGPPRPGKGHGWRLYLMLGLGVVALCLGMTGCAQFNKALGQQQALIYFKTSTPVSLNRGVRTACIRRGVCQGRRRSPPGVPLASAVDVVTYNTTGAGVADIARLEECVNKFAPQVEGVDVQRFLGR